MKNRQGFTLIELLAVIVIMGILMWAAVASYTRIITNSRRDAFASTAKTYAEAVSVSALANELTCYATSSGQATTAGGAAYSTLDTGKFVFYIATNEAVLGSLDFDAATTERITKNKIFTNTNDLLESGGKSSWGSADVFGYVYWEKDGSKATYQVLLQDTGGHGITSLADAETVGRSNVSTSGGGSTLSALNTTAQYICVLS